MDIEVNEYVRTPIGIFIISHINIDFANNDDTNAILKEEYIQDLIKANLVVKE